MNLENKVKNRFNISEILKKLLFRVSKLEKNSNVPSGDFIPLTGTEENKPVTGDIEIKGYSGKKIKSFFQGDGCNTIDLTRIDEGIVFEHYDPNNVKKVELRINGSNVYYAPMNGAEEYSVGFFSGIDHSKMSTGNNEADKLIYAQRSYVDKANSYSTDEIKTGGTWIDGKPIYRKCFVLGQITTASTGDDIVNLEDLYIDKIIDIKGTVFTDGSTYTINTDLRANSLGSTLVKYDTDFLSVFWTGIGDTSDFTIILEYTKTTD